MVVGAILPAGRPDQLVGLGEPPQLGAGDVGDAVGHAVDQVEAAAQILSTGPSKPKRLITPSTSTARIGLSSATEAA